MFTMRVRRIQKILDNHFIKSMIKKGKHILFEGGSKERDNIGTNHEVVKVSK